MPRASNAKRKSPRWIVPDAGGCAPAVDATVSRTSAVTLARTHRVTTPRPGQLLEVGNGSNDPRIRRSVTDHEELSLGRSRETARCTPPTRPAVIAPSMAPGAPRG